MFSFIHAWVNLQHSSDRLVLQQGKINRSGPTLHNNSQHSGEKFITWMERQKRITLLEISPLEQPEKNTFRYYSIFMQRALFNTNSLWRKEAVFNLFPITKKTQISVVLCLTSDDTFGTSHCSHCTSDHGQRVVVCLRCRCQSWCRTKGSIELATSHEYFTQTAKRPAERMSARPVYILCTRCVLYVPCSLDGKWQINVNSCPTEQ